MPDTNPNPDVPDAVQTTILQRSATPLLLFSGVLFLLLLASWLFLLPRFTQFAVAGTSLGPLQMASYTQQMRAQVTSLEQKRDQLVLPQMDPTYTALKAKKVMSPHLLDIRGTLIATAAPLANDPDVIVLQSMSLDGVSNTVFVSGDVVTKAPSSMTLLASYIDAVEKLPFVSHLVRPAFTRTQDGNGLFHSPFTMSFTFRPQ
jgi:hypothetical protein